MGREVVTHDTYKLDVDTRETRFQGFVFSMTPATSGQVRKSPRVLLSRFLVEPRGANGTGSEEPHVTFHSLENLGMLAHRSVSGVTEMLRAPASGPTGGKWHVFS